MTSWTEIPWLGFDTETTGVDVAADRLVTAALVERRAGADGTPGEDRSTAWLADPGVEIPARATAIHGITTERARAEGRPAPEVLDEVAAALVAHWRQGWPVVAFNATYDISLLDHELLRHRLESLRERLGADPMPVIDPLVLDRALDRYRKGKRTLAAMAPVYGVSVSPDAHSAEVDVTMTLEVLAGIARAYPQLAEWDAGQLHEYQRRAHREWATDFEKWLAGKGRQEVIEKNWPQP